MTMTLANFPVRGASIGSYGTCIELPSLDMALDIGRCPESAVYLKTVLISHGHMDHVGGAAHHCARRQLKKLEPPTYVVPHTLVQGFRDYIRACRKMDGSRMSCNIVSMTPDPVGIKLPTLPDRYTLHAFWAHHRRPTLGYIIKEERKRLKAEFQGLPGQELARLKRQEGVEITEEFQHPVLAFTGDTRPSILDEVPELLVVDLLIMEATFVDEQISPEDAWRTGHTHLEHLRERADQFQNKAVLFTHRSARHTPREFSEGIKSLPESLRKKCTPLLGRFPPSP